MSLSLVLEAVSMAREQLLWRLVAMSDVMQSCSTDQK